MHFLIEFKFEANEWDIFKLDFFNELNEEARIFVDPWLKTIGKRVEDNTTR
ncbi:MAG: hypothetical protein AB8G05_17590 [Oligoflexales bacterium]